ncbi:hypothetical protein SEA_FORZA_30 [Gordonia phage Forza]|uniref:Uncharacterized protein n=1 Tax=Gordonia phage Forza TaxID=2571247 RepID=A0A650EY60_9CAUD|nr:hypothetical protein PP303_gp030 [Gordonia phage Forza]QEM41499.1 hypothetical protein SEA_BOOPY_30 [Gordonia phage Boopy]QGT55023.1 hypothetical protein SEA_FORZA_30 [Gordonia phage Forza]UXE04172.1 hypothetical protein SEA_BLUENGOLD_28 [Gordonia phage BlueNGold]WBF03811.1 hypothetical protein SEA_MAREELIH_28 [Gordonia phage Mareelih]
MPTRAGGMTGAEHYLKAEEYLQAADPASADLRDVALVNAAAVHATLALAAAQVMTSLKVGGFTTNDLGRNWNKVVRPDNDLGIDD